MENNISKFYCWIKRENISFEKLEENLEEKMNGQTKTREQILNQDYMSAKDLKILIPTLGINSCRNIINEVVIDMRNDGCYVPPGKTIIALTKYVKKKLGIKERI